MKAEYTANFLKQLKKLKDKKLKEQVEAVIINVKKAEKPSEIQSLKKLSGHKSAYRIRVGDYRIGIFITKDTVEFVDFGHRKELYQTFPN